MSKCSRCGMELVTGDVHWDMGLCNGCWNVLFEQAKQKEPITMQSLGNWVVCSDCKDKDHRIAVLEKENESLKKDVLAWADGSVIVNYERELKGIYHKAHVLEKALSLAVEDKLKFENQFLKYTLGLEGDVKIAVPKKETYYIEQAEKELEGKDET